MHYGTGEREKDLNSQMSLAEMEETKTHHLTGIRVCFFLR